MRSRILAEERLSFGGPIEWLQVNEAARMLQLGPTGVHDLVRRQQLPCIRTRSGWRLFRRTDVERLADARMAARLAGQLRRAPSTTREPHQLSLFGVAKLRLVGGREPSEAKGSLEEPPAKGLRVLRKR